MRALQFPAAVLLAVSVAACTSDPYLTTTRPLKSGNWRIETQADRVTGAPLPSAIAATRNSATSEEQFLKPATIQLLCLNEKPVVRFAFEFKVGSTPDASLAYRFDDKPGHEPKVRFLRKGHTVVIEDRAAIVQFANELASSQVLYVRTRSLKSPRASAEFEVAGGKDAVDLAFASCPLAAPRRAAELGSPGKVQHRR